jgi:hypothetical protein
MRLIKSGGHGQTRTLCLTTRATSQTPTGPAGLAGCKREMWEKRMR